MLSMSDLGDSSVAQKTSSAVLDSAVRPTDIQSSTNTTALTTTALPADNDNNNNNYYNDNSSMLPMYSVR